MDTVEKGVLCARECWSQGFNCAESVMRGTCHALRIELSAQSKRMATPFGGGMGRSEDVCGALAGGVLAIGTVLGRTETAGDKLRSYEAARKLHEWFQSRFDSTACATLNKSDFKSPEHRTRCGRYVEETTRRAIEILSGHGD